MPPESPGSLGEDGYLGVMAYILQRNGNAPSDQTAARGERRVDRGRRRRRRAGGAAAPRPTGLLVRGTVEDFVPLTRSSAAQPGARRLADDPPRLQRVELQPARRRSRATTCRQLQLAWIWPMSEGGTNQPAPLAYSGTIYLNNTGGIIQALDGKTAA